LKKIVKNFFKMEKRIISPKEFDKMIKDIEMLRKEVEELRIADLKKNTEIKGLNEEITELKKNFASDDPFSTSQTAIFDERTSKSIDTTWIDEKKDVLAQNLKNLIKVLVDICNMPYAKNRNINMIPYLQASKNELQILEKFIIENKIKVKFILYDSRKQFSYFKTEKEVSEVKDKPKTYVFANTIGVKFDGSKFERLNIKLVNKKKDKMF